MCAIKPKRMGVFILKVYTAHEMTEEEWNELTHSKALEAEMKLNEDGRLRWHIKELNPIL